MQEDNDDGKRPNLYTSIPLIIHKAQPVYKDNPPNSGVAFLCPLWLLAGTSIKPALAAMMRNNGVSNKVETAPAINKSK